MFKFRCSKQLTRFLVLTLLLWSLSPGVTLGAGNLALSTPYPGISAQAGGTINFPLTIGGLGPVELEVVSIPSKWSADFYGDGMKIHQVYVPTKEDAQAELRVKVPSEVEGGTYKLVVKGTSGGASTRLSLNIKIDDDASDVDRIEVQYPALSGPDTATFSFRGTLYNNSGRARFYSLGANAPEGWEISFKPAYQDNQITSLSLEPGKSQDLDITVKPPRGVKAGEYTITAGAVHGSEVAETDLTVEISGTYRLDLSTSTGRLNADLTAGRKGALTLELENQGSADLRGIKFSANAPEGWATTFEPAELEVLKSGEKRQVTAYIRPDNKTVAGDYMITIKASAQETSESADIRVMVHTSTLWGLVGGIIIIGVISWLGWTFKKYGRR